MKSLQTLLTNRNFLLTLPGTAVIVGVALFALSEWLDLDQSPAWWYGLIALEIGAGALLWLFFNKRQMTRTSRAEEFYRHEQCSLLQQLKEAGDVHTQQLILDKMMSEDLLRRANLDQLALNDIHLEGANLEYVHLQQAVLPKVDLEGANLQQALLSHADLQQADLLRADLRNAEMSHIHLENATLASSNMSGANLRSACLRGASLYHAQLQSACLDHADLSGCCLMYANLQDASLKEAIFDEHTVLPNGETWKPDTDLQRFTDSSHQDFVVYAKPKSLLLNTQSAAD